MRKCFFSLLILSGFLSTHAQSGAIKNQKYPSLLWEITGNGLKKPSYLFGTMHVSSKMAFNLSDSFYLAIRSVDVVALETNPETWQRDMHKYDFENTSFMRNSAFGYSRNVPEDYLTQRTLKFDRYEKAMERALYSNPSVINNLLYRSYSSEASDFEEDTYLDMHLYQVGRKWGKQVIGVENFDESMRLMMEAYSDGMKDKSRKERRFDFNPDFSPNKLQDAYRAGNLDLLDTINVLNSSSAAFDEKFLYRRNDIQAASIDSVLRSGQTIFAGVGAAHLPGDRGVIEWLRSQGYKLRPIKMGQRNSHFKDEVEKLRVPVTFQKQTSADGFFKVDVPGQLQINTNKQAGYEQQQYADMANGSYYMITRVPTRSLLWGNTPERVIRQIDSVLYENIPGKIITKKAIVQNGFAGYDITNRTRRGDYQRYRIVTTPFEVLVFKMSGTGEYVITGKEGERFFSSIELATYKPEWKTFTPHYGGYSVEVPHTPFSNGLQDVQQWAQDANGTLYGILRTDIYNFEFAEEDTFDLGLMEESFSGSEFIQRTISRKHLAFKGYPALDVLYKTKDSGTLRARYLIQGPHYYTLLAKGNTETADMQRFLNSFTIKPFKYGLAKQLTDPDLLYTVTTPMLPDAKEELLASLKHLLEPATGDDENALLDKGVFKDKLVVNDTTGEKIYVSFHKSPQYFWKKDSAFTNIINEEDGWRVRQNNRVNGLNNMQVWEYQLTDTGSSRMIWSKVFYRNGVGYSVTTLTDTLSTPSSFVAAYFKTFMPVDTVQGVDPFVKKSGRFFTDFFSSDTLQHKTAVKNLLSVSFDGEDLPQLKTAITTLTWKEPKYLDVKRDFVSALGQLKTPAATNFLKELYLRANDTLELQYAALEALLEQQTKYSYSAFRDIVVNEPPVINLKTTSLYSSAYESGNNKGYELIYEALTDSLALTAVIAKDLLPLLNLDDYKYPVMQLMGTLVDSGYLQAKDYKAYLQKFLIEAKQELKKQTIIERSRSIQEAQKQDDDADEVVIYRSSGNEQKGNDVLSLYATLLAPFWTKNAAVPLFINQLLASTDKQLQYNTALLLLQHNKPLPDTLFAHLAKDDAFRYALFTELNRLQKAALFPKGYDKISLAKSKLMASVSYNKPDTLVYINKLPAVAGGKEGAVYFFKYKRNKNDASWKLATVGLVPAVDGAIEFYAKDKERFNFTELTDQVLDEAEPVEAQLTKLLRQQLFSKRKSAQNFYQPKQPDWMHGYDD